jgi:hypothetical protein
MQRQLIKPFCKVFCVTCSKAVIFLLFLLVLCVLKPRLDNDTNLRAVSIEKGDNRCAMVCDTCSSSVEAVVC